MRATEVGPNNRLARLNAQVGRVVLKAACLHHNAIDVACIVKKARAVILRGRGVVVRGIGIRATRSTRTATVKGVNGEVGPIVLVENNPLTVVCIGACAGDPITSISRKHRSLTDDGVVFGARCHSSHIPP